MDLVTGGCRAFAGSHRRIEAAQVHSRGVARATTRAKRNEGVPRAGQEVGRGAPRREWNDGTRTEWLSTMPSLPEMVSGLILYGACTGGVSRRTPDAKTGSKAATAMMIIGMLWFDDDPKRTFAEKVQRATDFYAGKFGVKPNACYVHPDTLKCDDGQSNGVAVRAAQTVLPHHFWIGVEEAA